MTLRPFELPVSKRWTTANKSYYLELEKHYPKRVWISEKHNIDLTEDSLYHSIKFHPLFDWISHVGKLPQILHAVGQEACLDKPWANCIEPNAVAWGCTEILGKDTQPQV